MSTESSDPQLQGAVLSAIPGGYGAETTEPGGLSVMEHTVDAAAEALAGAAAARRPGKFTIVVIDFTVSRSALEERPLVLAPGHGAALDGAGGQEPALISVSRNGNLHEGLLTPHRGAPSDRLPERPTLTGVIVAGLEELDRREVVGIAAAVRITLARTAAAVP